MVNSFLPSGSIRDWTAGQLPSPNTERLILRDDVRTVVDIISKISQSWRKDSSLWITDIDFVARLINTLMLRKTTNLRQMSTHNDSARFDQKWQAQSKLFAAFRLSLPPGYLNPKRDVLAGESKQSHSLRLVALIEIALNNIFQSLPRATDPLENQSWLNSWCTAVELTEDVVQIVKEWDSQMIYLAEPAIGYIAFIAMVLIQSQNRLDRRDPSLAKLEERSQESWQLLKLFLHQLSNHWLLSKALYGMFSSRCY